MGVDYKAMSAIGLAFDKEKLAVKKQVKLFNHDYPETRNFCY
jgi:hypothetical protein